MKGSAPSQATISGGFSTALTHQDTYSTRMLQKVPPFALQWLACPLPHD